MSAIMFDTLKLVDTLEQAALPREQARAIVDVVRESHEITLAGQSNIAQTTSERVSAELDTKTGREIASTRGEISNLRNDMELRFAKVEAELKLHRWMLGAILGGIVALVLKSFF